MIQDLLRVKIIVNVYNRLSSDGSRISCRGEHQPHRGLLTSEAVTFQNFVCRNERIWNPRGAWVEHAP